MFHWVNIATGNVWPQINPRWYYYLERIWSNSYLMELMGRPKTIIQLVDDSSSNIALCHEGLYRHNQHFKLNINQCCYTGRPICIHKYSGHNAAIFPMSTFLFPVKASMKQNIHPYRNCPAFSEFPVQFREVWIHDLEHDTRISVLHAWIPITF